MLEKTSITILHYTNVVSVQCLAVGKAYAVLSDTEQRRRYDLYGPEEVHVNRRRRRSSSDDDGDREFDPNEFFNMFFGGGFPNGRFL